LKLLDEDEKKSTLENDEKYMALKLSGEKKLIESQYILEVFKDEQTD
jgi:hypothetical protein